MSLNKARLGSLKDKLADIEAKEVPADAVAEAEIDVEEKGIKKELKKVKNGK